MKLLFDESLSPKLVGLLSDLFPDSQSALRNGLSGCGDLNILKYASDGGFVLVSTDSDFERLLDRVENGKVVILRSCNYPTQAAAEVLRKNAILIGELGRSDSRMILLDR
jgi:predicted nuclease of predicted toxin-antitoxin system